MKFRTGLERRIAEHEHTSLGAVFYFGAIGSFTRPLSAAEVFAIPVPGTPQRAALDRAFPVSKYPDLALETTRYVSLTPAGMDRALRQYGAGMRLTLGHPMRRR